MANPLTALPGTVNVAIIGVGLVGSAVISQILTSPVLSRALSIVALQNSKKLLLPTQSPSGGGAAAGLSPSGWKDALAASPHAAKSPKELIQLLTLLGAQGTSGQAGSAAARHTVVVDNTSNDSVAAAYPDFLRAGFSVVTPNKKAYSGAESLFKDILAALSAGPATGPAASNPAAARGGGAASSPLIYLESTVGAGLPIISTLKDLIATGDEIRKIEGVLSGTLSYIFNVWCPASLDSTEKFSDVVKVAKDNGYTEPYPGDDLSGSDVARKLTILTRLIPSLSSTLPLPEGYASVPTSSLTPAALQQAERAGEVKGGDDYIARLRAFDGEMDELREQAKREGKVWRYVGVIDAQGREIKAQLQKYDVGHPFAASLGASDNIISFTTARYEKRPLLVQGSGAGADVTAMGVVADLIKVAERRGA